ncbi:MAG: GNAT family N-acetyltransferase [Rhodobiaceae bacterium]|nr:GNAT family N-acetyltransferase [Rhodobiaceae bacterium]
MTIYAGTLEQQALQARVDIAMDWIMRTPGACNGGRVLATDDPERLGWDTIAAILERDRAFAFRLLPVIEMNIIADRLEGMGYRLDTWTVFSTGATTIRSKAWPIALDGPPEGYSELVIDEVTSPRVVAEFLEFIASRGLVPFSSAMMTGMLGPVEAVAAVDGDGRIVGSGFGYFPHNRFSDHAYAAWLGLLAVDEACRGKGVGQWINARVAMGLVERLGAQMVYELIADHNALSRRVVETCGFTRDPSLLSGIATRGRTRYTR